jgi:RHS repeat-associated protein
MKLKHAASQASARLALTLACLLQALLPVQAQTPPPPPASLAPVVKLEYDAQGNLKKTVLAPEVLNLGTAHDYDRLHRRYQTTDARSKTTRLFYNGREDLLQVTDPRSLVTQYPRNGLGDVTSLQSPDTGVATHTHDAAGNLRTRVDSRGVLATYSYDAQDRLTAIIYTQPGQPTQVHIWAYDQTGPGFSHGVGRLTSTQYPGGNTRYGYDAQGRLTSTTQQLEADAFLSLHTAYGYNAAGHLTHITYPSGRVLHIPHSDGVPTGLALAPFAAAAPVALVSAIQHEPFGAVRSWQWHLASGTWPHERAFDTSGRMVRHPLGGALRDISYDAADRISSYIHLDRASGTATAAAAALNQGFAYDELGRLLQVNTSVGNWVYTYDDNGNRTSVQLTPPVGTPTTRLHTVAATSNRLLALSNPPRSLAQDAAGNTWADQQGSLGWTASHDLSGRLTRIRATTNGSQYTTTSYVYDTAGQRVLKQPLSSETCTGTPPAIACRTFPIYAGGIAYVHGPNGQLLGEYDATTGAPIREYLWLQDLPLAVVAYDMATGTDPAPVFYIHTDHLNTPRVVLDRNGAQRWSWVAEPFGNSSPNTSPVGLAAFTLNLRMPGQVFDVESGLLYNWNRTYDAGVGRYTQSDPIGLAGGIDTYAYVGGNPVSYTDPEGLLAWGILFGGADLAWQLYQNGGNLRCVNWRDVGLSTVSGGLMSGLLKGAGKLSSSTKYADALREYRRAHNVPGRNSPDYQQVHHWFFEANGPIGRHVHDAIKNQPWNLNPVPKVVHDLIHGNAPGGAQYGALMRWWQGTPGWAKSVEAGVGGALFGPGSDCECPR